MKTRLQRKLSIVLTEKRREIEKEPKRKEERTNRTREEKACTKIIIKDRKGKTRRENTSDGRQGRQDTRTKENYGLALSLSLLPGEGTEMVLVVFFLAAVSIWLMMGWGSTPPLSNLHS